MKALEISSIVLTYFDQKGDLITNKKLQKLLYYIDAWCMVYHKPLIDEDFEAWVHGPVIPVVYQEFKSFGYSPIITQYQKNETADIKIKTLLEKYKMDNEHEEILFAVLEKYGSYTSIQLELLSHSESPWLEARKGLEMFQISSTPISKTLMKSYYSSKINN